MQEFLDKNEVMNYASPVVKAFIEEHAKGETPKEKAVALYYAVRDGIYYDPFDIRFEVSALQAEKILTKKRGHCVDKAVLYITLCRGVGIPARLGLARVRNHMGTARLEAILKTDVLNPHGYAEVFLDGRWVKCTPAFNKQLCERLGVPPLEFDGVHHSLFQAYDRDEGGFMSYLEDFGTFGDLPVGFLQETMQKEYPHLFEADGRFREELLARSE